MYYFQEWNKALPFIFWQKSRFRRIDYCADSGKKCDSLITNVDDSLNTTLMMPSNPIDFYTYRTYLFTQDNNKVRYIKHQSTYDKTTKQYYLPFYILDLDSSGHKIDSNYVQINTKYAVRNVVLKEYQKGKYVCSVFADNAQKSNTSPKEVKLVYFDANFKVEKIVDVTAFFPKFYSCGMSYIDKDNILLWAGTNIEKNGKGLFKITGILFKSSGEFIKSTGFDNYEVDTDNDENFNLTYLPSTKQMVLINTRKTIADKIINMEVLATNDKGQFDLLKTVPINVNGSTGIYDVTSIGDSSLLCRYKYVDPTSRNDFDAAVKWSVWALFPFSSLGFSTSTKEIIADNSVNYYPNPTHDILNINSKEEFNEIKVYSIEGRLIQKETNTDNTLNTDALPAGIYFFELWQGDKIVSHKLKFVKIE